MFAAKQSLLPLLHKKIEVQGRLLLVDCFYSSDFFLMNNIRQISAIMLLTLYGCIYLTLNPLRSLPSHPPSCQMDEALHSAAFGGETLGRALKATAKAHDAVSAETLQVCVVAGGWWLSWGVWECSVGCVFEWRCSASVCGRCSYV